MHFRLIYPKFKKFLEGHAELSALCADHLVGNYTMPPSLALPIIAALIPAPHTCSLTDDNIGQLIDFDEQPDCVVISCFTPQAQRAYEIADAFRARNTTVIIGGIHPSGAPQEALLHADAVCVGEVEPVWQEILADLLATALKPLYRAPDGYDLSQLPVPRRDIFAKDLYVWDAHLVMATRGCMVRCEGCPIPNKEGTQLRLRSVDAIVEDIRSMPYKEFYFTDDTLMFPGKKSMKFLTAIMEKTAELNVEIFLASTMMMINDPLYYRMLKKGGAASMYTVFGFDRASRQLLSKECTSAEWQAGIDLVRMNEDAGIHFFASYGIGFDDQDEGVIDRILKFSDNAGIDLAEFYIHTPFPGTPFGDAMTQQNRIIHRNYNQWNTGNVVFKPLHFTVDSLQQGFYRLWNDFYKDKKPVNTIKSFNVNLTE